MNTPDWTRKYQMSFWERESFLYDADVIIVGAGIVGVSTAISIKEKDPAKDVLVLERGFLPSGASTRNAGFACFGSVSELWDDLQSMDESVVSETLLMRWHGLDRLRSRLGDSRLNYNHAGGVEVFQNEQDWSFYAGKLPEINDRVSRLLGKNNIYTIDIDLCYKMGFSDLFGSFINNEEGVLSPGKMMQHLLEMARTKGIRFLFGANVQDIDEDMSHVRCRLPGATIKGKNLLIATNGFAARWFKDIDILPARNLVLVTQPLQRPLQSNAGFHLDRGYVYWRTIGNRLLIGGGRHQDFEGESTDTFGHSAKVREYLVSLLTNHILPNQQVGIEYEWSGIMGVGQVKKPIIDWHSERIALAIRMGGMGIAIGSLVGEKAAELILDEKRHK
jgi:gamma-glutamylputrescine oxidase